MEIIKPDRSDWLVNQFVLAVLNDGDWHRQVSAENIDRDCFGWFAKRTRPYLTRIARQFDMGISETEMGWVLAEIWSGCTCISNPMPLTPDFLCKYRAGANKVYFNPEELDGAVQSCSPLPDPAIHPELATLTIPSYEITQPNEIKEPTMKTETVNIKTATYINGADISVMNADNLIDAIQTCEAEIEALGKITTQSKAITAKVDRIKATIGQLVTFLDGDDSSAD